MRILKLLFIFLLIGSLAQAQKQDSLVKKYVQFSGFTIDAETFEPIPYIVVYDKTLRQSTMSDAYGFFSFVAALGDTILFRSITFKKSTYVIPMDVETSIYTHFQEMEHDVTMLDEAVIRPYSTKEELAYAFVFEDIPDDDILRAHKNFENMLRYAKEASIVDADLNYRWAMQDHILKTYYAGQYRPNALLNPLAWVQFFKMLKDGSFKAKP